MNEDNKVSLFVRCVPLDGSEPTIPQTNFPEYNMTPEKMAEYDRKINASEVE